MPDSPHEFLHDFLHPHLQAYEADSIAPPQLKQVKQVPVCLLQYQLLSVKHSRLPCHAAAILQPLGIMKIHLLKQKRLLYTAADTVEKHTSIQVVNRNQPNCLTNSCMWRLRE